MADSNAAQRQLKEALKHQDQGSWATFMQTHKVPLILAYYGFCSSTLIVINKVAVHTVQAPVFILVLQLLFSAVVVKGLNCAGVVEAEGLQWNLVKPFLLIVLGFLGTLYGEPCSSMRTRHDCKTQPVCTALHKPWQWPLPVSKPSRQTAAAAAA
eukprot:GHRQ01025298.1.p2 GENE.GHRQ01025298.1~~GHRQ01025298.1.p2  ORF type:complete len:155 (+),score=37.12 GHRQ01025298.1:734-1198(+)